MPRILIDADGCPVKEEVYRVAKRHGLGVMVVANAAIRVPPSDAIELVLVGERFGAVDDWIVEHIERDDVVITGDIPLAQRSLAKGARVLGPRGHVFSDDSIGNALANREMLSQLRELGVITGGPAPFEKRDRSRFLQQLDEIVRVVCRGRTDDGNKRARTLPP